MQNNPGDCKCGNSALIVGTHENSENKDLFFPPTRTCYLQSQCQLLAHTCTNSRKVRGYLQYYNHWHTHTHKL